MSLTEVKSETRDLNQAMFSLGLGLVPYPKQVLLHIGNFTDNNSAQTILN